MLLTEPAVLAELQLVRRIFFILGGCVVLALTLSAGKSDNVTHIFTS